eukprot:CAMPEP_0196659820 /NCGR_PEP_ID=MMETSP1086-20130531/36708_1 /TAXON_ID=77921 /ORGANISM="Cyanoptyche  gloeocystis , Strain SAG4.97" /LENGTH=81 /DNA_ID=CAMNT_0041993945 /DNA_START=143 /DNA_END=385 /DNA_ORIENTATION=+
MLNSDKITRADKSGNTRNSLCARQEVRGGGGEMMERNGAMYTAHQSGLEAVFGRSLLRGLVATKTRIKGQVQDELTEGGGP